MVHCCREQVVHRYREQMVHCCRELLPHHARESLVYCSSRSEICGAHAVQRHGEDALAVRECLDRQGQIELWFNPATGRHARVCQLQDKFGIQIVRADKEITSFIKEKMKRLDQVHTYLVNRGYLLSRVFP